MAIGKVLRSEDSSLQPGDVVFGYLSTSQMSLTVIAKFFSAQRHLPPDFSDYSVYPGKEPHFFKRPLTKIEKHPKLSYSSYLGPLGLPGHTAYSAFKTFMSEKAKTVSFLLRQSFALAHANSQDMEY